MNGEALPTKLAVGATLAFTLIAPAIASAGEIPPLANAFLVGRHRGLTAFSELMPHKRAASQVWFTKMARILAVAPAIRLGITQTHKKGAGLSFGQYTAKIHKQMGRQPPPPSDKSPQRTLLETLHIAYTRELDMGIHRHETHGHIAVKRYLARVIGSLAREQRITPAEHAEFSRAVNRIGSAGSIEDSYRLADHIAGTIARMALYDRMRMESTLER